jgi:hypothetical protein
MAKPNIRTVNKLIQSKHPNYAIAQGAGYVYVTGPNTEVWTATAVWTPRVSDYTPERWLAEVEHAVLNGGTDRT